MAIFRDDIDMVAFVALNVFCFWFVIWLMKSAIPYISRRIRQRGMLRSMIDEIEHRVFEIELRHNHKTAKKRMRKAKMKNKLQKTSGNIMQND